MYPPGSKSPGHWLVPPHIGLASYPCDPDCLGLPPPQPSAPSPGHLGARAVALAPPDESRKVRTARLRLEDAEQALAAERARFPGPVVKGEPLFSSEQELAVERVQYAQDLLMDSERIEAAVRRPLLDHLPAVLANIVTEYLDIDDGRSRAAGQCVSRADPGK